MSTVARCAVIVPCFNYGATVRDAVRSARAQESCQIVIVDDGSDDPRTIEVLEDLATEGIDVIRSSRHGVGAARSAGLAVASARYIFPLDADDYLVPNALTPLADYLDEHPDVALVWGRYRTVGTREHVRDVAAELDPWLITYAMNVPQSVLVRRDVLLAVGGWKTISGYEDWELMMSLAENGFTGRGLPLIVYNYRLHGPRGLARMQRLHDQHYRVLRDLHPRLFERRAETRRLSGAPLLLKIALPAVERLPRLTGTQKHFLYGVIGHLAYRRGGYLRILKLLARALVGRPPPDWRVTHADRGSR